MVIHITLTTMKTIQILRYSILSLCVVISAALVSAQEPDREREQRAEREEQMLLRKQMLEEQQEQMKEQHEKMKEMQKQIEVEIKNIPRISDDDLKVIREFEWNPDGNFNYVFRNSFDQGSRSQLTLRKNFDGTTDTSKGEFDVDEGIRNFRCMINGSVHSGEIHILLEYPDGKVFKELTINPSADINFSQSVSVKEGEESRYTGSWTYVIKANKAEGSYMLQIATN